MIRPCGSIGSRRAAPARARQRADAVRAECVRICRRAPAAGAGAVARRWQGRTRQPAVEDETSAASAPGRRRRAARRWLLVVADGLQRRADRRGGGAICDGLHGSDSRWSAPRVEETLDLAPALAPRQHVKRSPSSISVEPRGGSASPSRTITATSASRGSPSSRTCRPATAESAIDAELEQAAAEAVDGGDLERRLVDEPCARPSGPSLRASGSSVGPWISDEATTTKNTALKIVRLSVQPRRIGIGREHDRHRAAQPRPAEEARAREARSPGRASTARRRAGRATNSSGWRRSRARGGSPRELVREREQAEHDEQPDLREECEAARGS